MTTDQPRKPADNIITHSPSKSIDKNGLVNTYKLSERSIRIINSLPNLAEKHKEALIALGAEDNKE